jgi:hypothetical protein
VIKAYRYVILLTYLYLELIYSIVLYLFIYSATSNPDQFTEAMKYVKYKFKLVTGTQAGPAQH